MTDEINMRHFANDVLANANHPLPDGSDKIIPHCRTCGSDFLASTIDPNVRICPKCDVSIFKYEFRNMISEFNDYASLKLLPPEAASMAEALLALLEGVK